MTRACIAGLAAALASSAAFGVEAPCSGGWFSVRAELVRTMPASASVFRLETSGKQSELFDGQLLCEGDTLVVEPPLQYIEVRQGSRVFQVPVAEHRWTVPHGVAVAGAAAAEYVRLAMATLTVFSPPPSRPKATSVRGPEEGAPAPPRAIRFIDGGEHERLTADRPAIVAWSGGTPPFACVGDTASSTPTDAGTARWCEFRAPLARQAGSIGMSASDGKAIRWKIEKRAWRDVPRPDWVAHSEAPPASAIDELAWALWLWQHAPADWRLQSLSMLDDAARSEWLAGYVLDLTLNEAPPTLPQ